MTGSGRRGRMVGRVALLSLLLMPALLLGCKGNSKTKGPSAVTGPTSITGTATGANFVLTITINPNAIPPGGTAGITVTATTFNGAPLANRDVVMGTTAGTLSKVSGKTDAAGKFVTSITMTDPRVTGTVQITATAMALTVEAILNVIQPGELKVFPESATLAPGQQQIFNCAGGVPPFRWEPSGGTVNVSTGPTVTYTAGSQLGTFTLKCTDSAGNVAGATITISTTALNILPGDVTLRPGQVQVFQVTGGVPPYTWTATGGTPTTGAGDTFTYTAGSTPGVFNVTVRDSTGQFKSVKVTISVSALAVVPSAVTLAPGQVQVFQASGGLAPFTWTASGGTPTSGTGSSFTYTAGSAAGVFTVSVKDGTGRIASATVTITVPTIGFINVTANPGSVTCGGASTITATVTDTNGAPLAGVQVTFSADKGSLSATTATTNGSGQASVTWTASNIPVCISGTAVSGDSEDATITASSGSVSDDVTVTVVKP